MKFIEWFIEAFNWLKIVLAITFVFAIGGGIYYGYHQDRLGIFIGSCITAVGLVIGITWAIRIWKKEGATNFLARNNASPDIDEILKKNDSDKAG